MLKSSQSAVLSLSTEYNWLIQLWHTYTGFNILYWFFCHWGHWTRSSKVLCWTLDLYGTFIRDTISLYMCKERGKEIILVDYLLQLQISLYVFKTNIFLYMCMEGRKDRRKVEDTPCVLANTDTYFGVYVQILEKEMAAQSSTLSWEMQWVEEPARLQSMGFTVLYTT